MAALVDLDHLALAFERAFDGFDRYVGDLGARPTGGGTDPGFSWHQVQWANGMVIELLEPADVTVDDFLRRFLDRNGPGPHHMTFHVPDIHAAIHAATASGRPPVRVNLEHDDWREAFLHPKAAHGIVVQLAQTTAHERTPIEGVPRGRVDEAARLERVALLVADVDAARSLFEGVLGGEPVDRGEDAEGRYVELAWPGPGRVRLVAPTTAAAVAWLGDRPGRVHHVALACAHPAAVPRAAPLADGSWEVAPEHNLGTRLRLRPL